MPDLRVLVVRTAGINCDEETMHCWRLAGAKAKLVHINVLAKNPDMVDEFSIVTIPGGFSYGDDIAAGKILAQRIVHDLTGALERLVVRGGGILGICNGFQVLVKMGLLPGGHVGRGEVTVTYNDSARFEARWVRLEVGTTRCPFLPSSTLMPSPSDAHGVDSARRAPAQETPQRAPVALAMPVEHAEGKVVTASDDVVQRLTASEQIALRYVDEHGRTDTYPANPNGSEAGIAGLCDPTGRILGLMPHPDRHFDRTQHPLWTRQAADGPPDGLAVFQRAVSHWRGS